MGSGSANFSGTRDQNLLRFLDQKSEFWAKNGITDQKNIPSVTTLRFRVRIVDHFSNPVLLVRLCYIYCKFIVTFKSVDVVKR